MELNVTSRSVLGKKVNSLRSEGFVPGEVFGHGFENRHISVSKKDLSKAYKEAGESSVITLVLDGKEKITTLISNLEQHHISGEYLSVDFRFVKSDEKIRTHVPVTYTGVDNASKADLLLVKVLNEVEIEAFPQNIPHEFEVDITPLKESGQSISVSDLSHDDKVEILTDPETIVVTVSEKREEPEPEETEEEGETPSETEEKKGEKEPEKESEEKSSE